MGGLNVLLEVVTLGESLGAVGAGQGGRLGRVAHCNVPCQAVLLYKALATVGAGEGGWVG